MLARSDSVPPPETACATLMLAGTEVVLDPAGALVWPERRMVVAADLHLEKASAFARRGQMLPPYDTLETLALLARVVERWRPDVVVALGDSLHDRWGAERLAPEARARLAAIQSGRSFVWIAGNHDPERTVLEGDFAEELKVGPLLFRHEPQDDGAAVGEVAGHLHPVARVVQRGCAIRRRCFATDGRRMVLPAMGALAGGLDVRHPALSSLFARATFAAHLLGAGRTYRFDAAACLK